MAHSQNSLELPININATQITTAYGHRALPKLKEELQSEDLQTRQKALMALCDLMHDPECIYKAMNIGCMENLKALLKDSNSMVRIKTTEVLYITASHSVGRYAFLEHDIVLALSFLLNDPSPVCRGNLYKAYMQLVQVPRGAQEIISKGLISSLVWKLQVEVEEEEFQEFILDTLVLCLQEDATEALGSNVVLVLKQKLLSANQNIRSKAARALLNVSISREGKKQVCHFDVIPILVHLLKDPVEHVKSNAAGALMFATVITEEMESHYVAQAGLELLGRIRGWMERSQLRPERQEMKRPGPGRTQRRCKSPEGKYAALEAQAIGPLLELLHSPMTIARLNATKALTMLAEAPEGRKALQTHVPTFRAMEVETYEKPQVAEALQRAARIAISVIEFKP
ncbi:radial spoke head 14 homolog isoform X1 [Gorilla gorilla gorilla]|uniref:radial spoke head 14 homolog isoform X1 n=1 Tax=Gorilla gorilla gorilla TaxID=9595 RepID=UPI0024462C97|nr:radial spoke head 14 homolog isoform X1 [Gorilla gorilla gorilla]XP_055231072.1 radial spoke head 14 homolog isoform X1 [Gorilla gorilla gorilla]XP_055231073.1 radial spoke head 14 homolog isoform X1 [Gorilla gorilla gorilla]